MSIELSSLENLTPEEVQNKQDVLAEILQETYPNLDIKRGALRDIVLHLHSILAAKVSKEIDRYKSAQSLLAITNNGDLAENGVVDNVLSNYNIYRNNATYTTGTIRIVVEYDTTLLILEDTEFEINGDIYYVPETILIGDSDSDEAYDYQFLEQRDGTFTVDIDVISREAGELTPVNRGDTLTTDLEDVIHVVATRKFTPGKQIESNIQILDRLSEGLATPCWGNRQQIAALIKEKVDSVTAISVVGFGDKEMKRDKLTALPVSVGGKADIYVKTAVIENTFTVPAYFEGMSGIYERWSVSIPADLFPGCYRITGASKGNHDLIVSDQLVLNGWDFTADQTLHITLLSEDSAVLQKIGATENVDISIIGQIDIDRVTRIFNDKELMPVTEDALVRSAFPAWVTVNVTLSAFGNNENKIASAIQNYINNTGFETKILASEIVEAIYPELLPRQKIISIALSSEVWGPDNKVFKAVGSQVVTPPTDLDTGVTDKTTVFYCQSVEFSYSCY